MRCILFSVSLLMCTMCFPGKVTAQTVLDSVQITNPPVVKEMEGTIEKKQFYNKANRKIEGVYDLFFVMGKERLFIKTRSHTVSRDQLEPYIGKKIKVEASILEGMWDADDPNIQSRIGRYISIFKILE